MKVAELMEILKGANPEAEIKLAAKYGFDDGFNSEQILIKEDGIEIDLANFVDEWDDFNEMLGAL